MFKQFSIQCVVVNSETDREVVSAHTGCGLVGYARPAIGPAGFSFFLHQLFFSNAALLNARCLRSIKILTQVCGVQQALVCVAN